MIRTRPTQHPARACADPALDVEPRLLDLDDLCLSRVLVRATALPPDTFSASIDDDDDKNDEDDDDSPAAPLVDCSRLMLVCRRFRDLLLFKATGTRACDSHNLLRFAFALRRLEISENSSHLPWRGQLRGDRVHVDPPAMAHLTNLTRLQLSEGSLPDPDTGLQAIVALPLLQDLELRSAYFEDGSELQGLARLTALTSLRLPCLNVMHAPRSSMQCLSSLQALRSLGLPDMSPGSESILRFITALTALSALDVRRVTFGVFVGRPKGSPSQFQPSAAHDALLKIASGVQALQQLRFPFDRVTDDGFAHVSRLTRLTALDLAPVGRMHHLSERGLQHVAALLGLRKLDLTGRGCWRVPPLSGLTALEALSLDVEAASGARVVAGLSALTQLRLRRLSREQRERVFAQTITTLAALCQLELRGFFFDAATATAVGTLHAVRRLSLLDCDVADGVLGALTQLDELTVQDGDVSAGALSQVTLLTRLRALNLTRDRSGPFVVGSVVAAIAAALPRLTRLELDVGSMQDSDLAGLPSLTALRALALSSESIGQQGLASIAALHALTRLKVRASGSAVPGALTCVTALRRLVSLDLGLGGDVDSVAVLACTLPLLRQLHARVDELPSKDSAAVARLAHLRGGLFASLKQLRLGSN